jgi:predicted acetyltransferase
MPELVEPTTRLRQSFVEAILEFQQDRDFPAPWFVRDVEPEALVDPAAFAAYVERVRSEREEATARAIGFVPMTTLWWVEGDRMLGRVGIRHRLTEALKLAGGHIGYDVRPSARGRGHATSILAAALPVAASLGISEALLTCDETNVASQKVIEANGGRLIDILQGKLRYWVPAGAASGGEDQAP